MKKITDKDRFNWIQKDDNCFIKYNGVWFCYKRGSDFMLYDRNLRKAVDKAIKNNEPSR